MQSIETQNVQGSAEARMREFLGAMNGGKGRGAEEQALPATGAGPRTQHVQVPALLVRAARKAVQGTPAAQDLAAIEDIAGAVLEQIVRRAEAAELAQLTGKKLRAALAQRARQAAAELWPRWNLRKQLREHVVRALEALGDAPVAAAPQPMGLLIDGRFCAEQISAAVRSLLGAAVRRHPTELTAALMKLYFPSDTSLDGLAEVQSPAMLQDELLATAMDAPRIAARLHRMLGKELSRILSLQLLGRKLREIAAEVGLAVATVHARLKVCERKLRAYRDRMAASFELMRAALQHFVLHFG